MHVLCVLPFLIPGTVQCKTDAELRKRTKKVIDVYQKEKKVGCDVERKLCLKKNLNASRLSEHPPVRSGGKCLNV